MARDELTDDENKDRWRVAFVSVDRGWDWHDGHGWYLILDEYPEEGSCGSFRTCDDAAAWVDASGGVLINARRKGPEQ